MAQISSPVDPTDRTRRTYDAVALAFLEEHGDRSRLRARMGRFAAALPGACPVLDVGSGPCHDSAELRALGLTVVSVDLSGACLRIARDRFPGPRVQADMRRLPFAAGCAAGLWVNASLLHVPRPDVSATLTGFRRLLVPKGVLHLSVKAGGPDGWDARYGPQSLRWFTYWTDSSLDAALAGAGFCVLEAEQSVHPSVTWLVRLARSS
ncbi:MAG: class I SAM-dependent methyltransferase [Candidatus Latescibacterota bacterium]